jgi:hypothetical protein
MARHLHAVAHGPAGSVTPDWWMRFRRTEHPGLRLAAGLMLWAALMLGFLLPFRLGTLNGRRPQQVGPGGYHPANRTGQTTQADLARSDWADYGVRQP